MDDDNMFGDWRIMYAVVIHDLTTPVLDPIKDEQS